MITKLTKTQEAQIPKYIERYISLASKPTDRKKATKAVQNLYENAGHKKPIVIFAKSPLATAVMVAITKILSKDGLASDGSQLYSQLHSQLHSQLNSQLDSQLWSQLGSQLYSQLYSQLRSQLDSQLGSQLGSQLWSQLGSQLYSQLGSQLHSQLNSQLDSQLDSQLRSQLDSQLDSQLRSQLDSQLNSQLGSQLNSQLWSQLGSQLGSQLNSQLGSQLGSQLHSQLGSQLGSQLNSQLWSQLGSQLGSQLNSINQNWWLLVWWIIWAGWYAFAEYIGVKFNNKNLKLFMDFVTNVSFIIPYEGIAFVSETPQFITWSDNKLHNTDGKAVEYSDGYGLYSLYGVNFDEKLWKQATSKKPRIKTILSIENMEQRMAALKVVGVEKIIKKGQLVNKSKRGNELYLIKDVFTQDALFLKYKCPSTGRVYVSGVEPSLPHDADKCMAWKFSMTPDEYAKLEIEA